MVTDANHKVIARRRLFTPVRRKRSRLLTRAEDRSGVSMVAVNQKFTGKERDAETGLDYFRARYFGSALGVC